MFIMNFAMQPVTLYSLLMHWYFSGVPEAVFGCLLDQRGAARAITILSCVLHVACSLWLSHQVQ